MAVILDIFLSTALNKPPMPRLTILFDNDPGNAAKAAFGQAFEAPCHAGGVGREIVTIQDPLPDSQIGT